jgi:hypothetical protein
MASSFLAQAANLPSLSLQRTSQDLQPPIRSTAITADEELMHLARNKLVASVRRLPT